VRLGALARLVPAGRAAPIWSVLRIVTVQSYYDLPPAGTASVAAPG
jgi:hypothetical protein